MPQLTIDTIHDPALPVVDTWQVFWDRMPLSDVQVAQLARDDTLIEKARAEIDARGTWVYVGTLMAAAGTALSSAGWILFGQGKQPHRITLPLALGGIGLGGLGLVTITDAIQTPLEPLLAPTPEHRLSRAELRELVSRINRRLYQEICEAADAASTPAPERR